MTGWNITIKSESQAEDEKTAEEAPEIDTVQEVGEPGILDSFSEKISAGLTEAGYDSAESIVSASDKELLGVPGVGPKAVEKLRGLAGSLKGSEEITQESTGETAGEAAGEE